MNILLIGNGGREHAVAKAMARSKHQPKIFVFANKVNPGICALAADYYVHANLSDFEAVKKYAETIKPDFAFIGPDNPIGDGVADVLEEMGVKCVAPRKAPAQLESSKSFTRNLLQKYEIPGNPKFQRFTSEQGCLEFLKELGDQYVVKADGLAFGKGVKVSGDHLKSHDEAMVFVQECLGSGPSTVGRHSSVVIEEKLEGVEFSLMAFADGAHLAFMPVVQDHKRAFEGDLGPNTGGMGSYSCPDHSMPFLLEKDLEDAKDICRKVLLAVKQETGQKYRGILYGGFMAVSDGVKLIEFNARFGDPEAMNVLPILETDFVDICQAILSGTLDKFPIRFARKATVCLYVVPEGYPDSSKVGEALTIGVMPRGVELFYSSVNVRGDANTRIPRESTNSSNGRVVTTSSRSIGVVGIANTIEAARKLAVEGVRQIKGKICYRSDIGSPELIEKRVSFLRSLRR